MVYNWDSPFRGRDEVNWINIPEKGLCRIQLDRLSKLKGLTESVYTNLSLQILNSSIEKHVCECVGEVIITFIHPSPLPNQSKILPHLKYLHPLHEPHPLTPPHDHRPPPKPLQRGPFLPTTSLQSDDSSR